MQTSIRIRPGSALERLLKAGGEAGPTERIHAIAERYEVLLLAIAQKAIALDEQEAAQCLPR